MLRLALLGTGTGVGKTFVGCQFLGVARKLRLSALGLKPVETGVTATDNAPAPNSDGALLEAASFHVKQPRPHPRYHFSDPISPHLAARRSNTSIEVSKLVHWVSRAEAGASPTLDLSVVETAGGLLTPVTDTETNLDLATALEPARLVLVAADALGTLHDTQAAIVAMEAMARAPDAIVLSAARPRDASTGTNLDELRRLPRCAERKLIDASDSQALARLLQAWRA